MEGFDLMQAISTVGFPIAAFCLMWHTQNKTLKEMKESFDRLISVISAKIDNI